MKRKRGSKAIVQQPAAQFYDRFVEGIKQRIRAAQIKAAISANRELILLYWDIGRATPPKTVTSCATIRPGVSRKCYRLISSSMSRSGALASIVRKSKMYGSFSIRHVLTHQEYDAGKWKE